MFSEPQPGENGRVARWLEEFARRRPGGFDAFLILLAVAATIILLVQKEYSFVLYQGF
jgi:hypothetical protein